MGTSLGSMLLLKGKFGGYFCLKRVAIFSLRGQRQFNAVTIVYVAGPIIEYVVVVSVSWPMFIQRTTLIQIVAGTVVQVIDKEYHTSPMFMRIFF